MAKTVDCLISVFAKAPDAGQVKSRLIPLLGADGAAQFHEDCVMRTLETACLSSVGQVELCCAPDVNHAFFARCAGHFGVALTPQGGGDLGARMQRALARGLARHAKTVIIGCDCPALTAHDLREAAHALDAADAVFSPAEDGGYVLVGGRKADARLFEDVTWGDEQVMEKTRANLAAMGWTWHELATRWDVDRPEDYLRLKKSGLSMFL
jgi:hypothetical protein